MGNPRPRLRSEKTANGEERSEGKQIYEKKLAMIFIKLTFERIRGGRNRYPFLPLVKFF